MCLFSDHISLMLTESSSQIFHLVIYILLLIRLCRIWTGGAPDARHETCKHIWTCLLNISSFARGGQRHGSRSLRCRRLRRQMLKKFDMKFPHSDAKPCAAVSADIAKKNS